MRPARFSAVVLSVFLVFPVLLGVFPAQAAETGTVTLFGDGSATSEVNVTDPGARAAGPTIELAAGAVVDGFSFDVHAPPAPADVLFGDSRDEDFSAGTAEHGLTVAAGGLALEGVSWEHVEDLDALMGDGRAGLEARGGGLMIAPGSASGTATFSISPPEMPGLLVLSAHAETPDGTAITFDLLDDGGSPLATGVQPGEPVRTGSLPATPASVRVVLATARPPLSPVVDSLHVGTALRDDMLSPSAVVRSGPAGAPAGNAPLVSPADPTSFRRVTDNAVIGHGPSGSWWEGGLEVGSVIRVGFEYWAYINSNGIGRAVSGDFVNWSVDPAPLLTAAGAAESVGIQLAHVVLDPNRARYNMYYTCNGDSGYGLCMATSPDALEWTRCTCNPIILPEASTWTESRVIRGAVTIVGTTYTLMAEGTPDGIRTDIGLWTSADGENWTADPANPTFPRGGSGDDFDVNGGDLVFDGQQYLLFYSCATSGYQWGVCLATSPDARSAWTRHGRVISNDLSGFDGTAAYFPGVVFAQGRYRMLYTGLWGNEAGAAFSVFQPGDFNFTGRFDFSSGSPRTFHVFNASVDAPGTAAASISVRTSADGTSWSAPQPVVPGTNLSNVQVRQYVEVAVRLSGASASESASVRSMSIGFEPAPADAAFTSRQFQWEGAVERLTTTAVTSGSSSGLAWQWRLSDTDPWDDFFPGYPVDFGGAGANGTATSLQYRLAGSPSPDARFVLSSVRFSGIGTTSIVQLAILIGLEDAPVLWELYNLFVPQTVEPPRALINASAAVAAERNPTGGTVTLRVWVISPMPGTVRFSNLTVSYRVPGQPTGVPPDGGNGRPTEAGPDLAWVLILVALGGGAAGGFVAGRAVRSKADGDGGGPQPPA